MATKMKIRKVNALPGTFEPSTLYLVKSAEAGLFEMHMSTSDGLSTRHIYSKAEITSQIAAAVGATSSIHVVADIAARNALAPTTNIFVLVADASDDVTVTAGAATYIYNTDTTSWVKIAEYESMDFVFSWANLSDKPTSSVADIDSAVSLKHTHSNKAQLDKITEDVNGDILYNAAPIRAHLEIDEW